MLNLKDFYKNRDYNSRRDYLRNSPQINAELEKSCKKLIVVDDVSNKTVFFEKSIKLDRLSLKNRTDFKYTSDINKADVIVLNRTNTPYLSLSTWGTPAHLDFTQYLLNNLSKQIHIMYFQNYLNKHEKVENSDVELTPEFVNNFNNMITSRNIMGAITFLEVLDNTNFSDNLNCAIHNTIINYVKPNSPNLVLYNTRLGRLKSKYKFDNSSVFYRGINSLYKETIENKESFDLFYKELPYIDYFNRIDRTNYSLERHLEFFNQFITKHFSNEKI